MQAADEVYSLIGGQVPFVLRPRNQKMRVSKSSPRESEDEEQVEVFELLGEDYVHCFVDGEVWRRRGKKWWPW